jgi:hypothetical protein
MTEPHEESVAQHEHDAREREGWRDPEDDRRIPLTPRLIILGLLAVGLGLFAAIVMSAHSLAR